ncbi:MAG: UBP-type zinc finger domain-containing protein [Vicinamibacterales bacterium]
MSADTHCPHFYGIANPKQSKVRHCDECVTTGGKWVHLRTCQSCGATLCCDASPNRHASKHATTRSHPVVASAEPGERWLYCYPDDTTTEY